MKRKNMIIVFVLLLVIGFAAVSTTLVITGVIGVSTKKSDFIIKFTNAKLGEVERKDFINADDPKLLDYTIENLTEVGASTTLNYEVTNTSRVYDAEVSITCNIVDNDDNPTTSEYISMDYAPNSMIVRAGQTESGNITTTLIKSSTTDQDIKVKCELKVNGSERTELGEEYNDPNKIGGKLQKSSINFWQINKNVTKIVFENKINPRITTDDLIFDKSENQDGSVMVYAVNNNNATGSDARYDLYVQSDGKIIANEDSSYLFYGMSRLETIEGIENLITSEVTNMSNMFYGCSKVSILNLSSFDTSQVTNMSNMFYGCSKVSTLNLSGFNTSQVTNMVNMFDSCESLSSLDLSSFDTKNVTSMSMVFKQCTSLNMLDIRNFDVSKVTTVDRMFDGMPVNSIIKVKNAEMQNWVLNFTGEGLITGNSRPSEWTTENVIIV